METEHLLLWTAIVITNIIILYHVSRIGRIFNIMLKTMSTITDILSKSSNKK